LIVRANKRLSEHERAAHHMVEADVCKYVSYEAEPLVNVPESTELLETVSEELHRLKMMSNGPDSTTGLKTKWLVEKPSDFGFLNADNIKNYNGILTLQTNHRE
jgi:hypothetical protein